MSEQALSTASAPVASRPPRTPSNALAEPDERGFAGTVGTVEVDDSTMTCRAVNVYYDDKHAIRDVDLDIAEVSHFEYIFYVVAEPVLAIAVAGQSANRMPVGIGWFWLAMPGT